MSSSTDLPAQSGPITGGVHGRPFGSPMLDISSYGYLEEEYFFEGTAHCYRLRGDGAYVSDGHWAVETVDRSKFRSRLLVYKPADPSRFNGTVIVLWNNVSAGYEVMSIDSLELFEEGYAIACVSAQKAGIDGLLPVKQGLKSWDAERYASLDIPGDDYSFDIFTQAALLLRESSGPLSGFDVKHLVAYGASQSAGWLATYINAIAPLGNPFDGFILSVYFGTGMPLESEGPPINVNDPDQHTVDFESISGQSQLRDNLGVPIFVVNSELEAIACLGVRQPDTETFRYWEAASTCHISQQIDALRQERSERDGIVSGRLEEGINAIPMNPIYDSVLHHMHCWVSEGLSPPIMPRIEFSGEGSEIMRDEHGIALGGVRLPQADVPLAQNSAIPRSDKDMLALLAGSCRPFSKEKVESLYGDVDKYIEQFTRAAAAAVDAGVLRSREVDQLLAEARLIAEPLFAGTSR